MSPGFNCANFITRMKTRGREYSGQFQSALNAENWRGSSQNARKHSRRYRPVTSCNLLRECNFQVRDDVVFNHHKTGPNNIKRLMALRDGYQFQYAEGHEGLAADSFILYSVDRTHRSQT